MRVRPRWTREAYACTNAWRPSTPACNGRRKKGGPEHPAASLAAFAHHPGQGVERHGRRLATAEGHLPVDPSGRPDPGQSSAPLQRRRPGPLSGAARPTRRLHRHRRRRALSLLEGTLSEDLPQLLVGTVPLLRCPRLTAAYQQRPGALLWRLAPSRATDHRTQGPGPESARAPSSWSRAARNWPRGSATWSTASSG